MANETIFQMQKDAVDIYSVASRLVQMSCNAMRAALNETDAYATASVIRVLAGEYMSKRDEEKVPAAVADKALLDQLNAELRDLSERYAQLNTYLNNGQDQGLDNEARRLLREQHEAMHKYLVILQRRTSIVASKLSASSLLAVQTRKQNFATHGVSFGEQSSDARTPARHSDQPDERTTARHSDRPDQEITGDELRTTGQDRREDPMDFRNPGIR